LIATVNQSSQTVDAAVSDGYVKARLTSPISGVRRRTCFEKSPHDVATIRDDTQV